MIGEVVNHILFGKGTIVSTKQTANDKFYIMVEFCANKAEFVFPDAFESFLQAESDELRNRINESFEKIQSAKKEEQRKKELEEAKKNLRLAQDSVEALKLNACVTKSTSSGVNNIITGLEKGLPYGTVAKEIYRRCCEAFGWFLGEEGKFAKQKKLYSERATPEGYSVWMLPHSNKTGSDNGTVENVIYADCVEQRWKIYDHGKPKKIKRLMFYKENGVYYFGGIYLFDGYVQLDEKYDTKYCDVEKFVLVSKTYPEK